METERSNKVSFHLDNPHLGEDDHLYHLGLLPTDNLEQRFGDVEFVCMGGKPKRMHELANYLYQMLGKPKNCEFETVDGRTVLKDIAASAGRYSLYKVGPTLSVSHGIGMASLSVVFNEVLKLLHYAKCSKDIEVFRIGTCGGLGLDPGTIVVTKQPYDSQLNPSFQQVSCGKAIRLDCRTDERLRSSLFEAAKKANIPVMYGNTMATDDFFEGQARVDGAFCAYSNDEKKAFLQKAHDEFGIKNIEMECTCLSAMCARAGVKCAIACVTVINRLERDDVTADGSLLQSWQENLYRMMAEYILNYR